MRHLQPWLSQVLDLTTGALLAARHSTPSRRPSDLPLQGAFLARDRGGGLIAARRQPPRPIDARQEGRQVPHLESDRLLSAGGARHQRWRALSVALLTPASGRTSSRSSFRSSGVSSCCRNRSVRPFPGTRRLPRADKVWQPPSSAPSLSPSSSGCLGGGRPRTPTARGRARSARSGGWTWPGGACAGLARTSSRVAVAVGQDASLDSHVSVVFVRSSDVHTCLLVAHPSSYVHPPPHHGAHDLLELESRPARQTRHEKELGVERLRKPRGSTEAPRTEVG